MQGFMVVTASALNHRFTYLKDSWTDCMHDLMAVASIRCPELQVVSRISIDLIYFRKVRLVA